MAEELPKSGGESAEDDEPEFSKQNQHAVSHSETEEGKAVTTETDTQIETEIHPSKSEKRKIENIAKDVISKAETTAERVLEKAEIKAREIIEHGTKDRSAEQVITLAALENVWHRIFRCLCAITIVLFCIVIVETSMWLVIRNVGDNQRISIENQRKISDAYNERIKDVTELLGLIKEEEKTRLSGDSDFVFRWKEKMDTFEDKWALVFARIDGLENLIAHVNGLMNEALAITPSPTPIPLLKKAPR